MTYTFQSNINQSDFDAFVRNSPLSNIMQHSHWAKVKQDWHSMLCGVYQNGELQACALLLTRKLMFGFTLGYIPRGPIMDYTNETLVDFMLDSLYQLARKKRILSIKFDPNLYKTFPLTQKAEARKARLDEITALLAKHRYCIHKGYAEDMYDNTQPRHQLCFYDTEGILDVFPKKTKEKINQAFTYHVEIEEHGIESVDEFQKMIACTEQRKGIVLRNAQYFANMMDAYKDESVLLFAYLNQDALIHTLTTKKQEFLDELNQLPENAHKKKEILLKRIAKTTKELETVTNDRKKDGPRPLVSALLLVRDAITTELLYSGLNGHYKQYLAPYALRHHAIAWSIKNGCRRFNFGGVQGSFDDGLFEFKSAFHPSIDVYVGEFDIVVNAAMYHVIETLIPTLKKWKLKMAKRRKRDAH